MEYIDASSEINISKFNNIIMTLVKKSSKKEIVINSLSDYIEIIYSLNKESIIDDAVLCCKICRFVDKYIFFFKVALPKTIINELTRDYKEIMERLNEYIEN